MGVPPRDLPNWVRIQLNTNPIVALRYLQMSSVIADTVSSPAKVTVTKFLMTFLDGDGGK